MKKVLSFQVYFAVFFSILTIGTKAQTYVNVPITGFNQDLVANGVGTPASSTSLAAGIDGDMYVIIDNTYKYSSGCATGTYSTNVYPSGGTIASTAASGLVYTLQSSTGSNAIRVPATGTGSGSATVTLTTPIACQTLYLLSMSDGGTVTITVTFTGGTTQVFTALTTENWCTNGTSGNYTTIGTTNYYRVQTTAGCGGLGTCEYFGELKLALSPANYTKTVASIAVTQNTSGDTYTVWALGAQPYTAVTVPVTGFNADVVANGTGTSESSTTAAVDVAGIGTGYDFVSTTFNPGSGICTSGADALPASNTITSTTTGITYTLQSYSANNVLKIAEGSSGTLTFTTPTYASTIYVVCTVGSGNGTNDFTPTITYADGSTSTPAAVEVNNWCTSGSNQLTSQEYYRIPNGTATTCGGGDCDYLFEAPITGVNTCSPVTKISFAFNSGAGYLNIFAVGAQPPTPAAVAGTLTVSQPCNAPTTTVTLTGSTGSIQFQTSPNATGGPWTNYGTAGCTSSFTYTAASTTYFQAVVTAANGTTATSNTVTTIVGSTGDQVTYGNGQWIGYVYNNATGSSNSFTPADYSGWVSEPAGGDGTYPDFTELWGQADNNPPVNYPTLLCAPTGTNFSIRYKTQISEPAGFYYVTIGSDDGSRLYISQSASSATGAASSNPFGTTYLINDNWGGTQGYTTASSTVYWPGGTMYLTYEYYQGTGGAEVSFNMCEVGTATDGYGTFPSWNAYAYDNTSALSTASSDPDPGGALTYPAGNYTGYFTNSSPSGTYSVGSNYTLLNDNWAGGSPRSIVTFNPTSNTCNAAWNAPTTDWTARFKTTRTYSNPTSGAIGGYYYYTTPGNDDGAELDINGTAVISNFSTGAATFNGTTYQPNATGVNVQYQYQQQGGGSATNLTECLMGGDQSFGTFPTWHATVFNANPGFTDNTFTAAFSTTTTGYPSTQIYNYFNGNAPTSLSGITVTSQTCGKTQVGGTDFSIRYRTNETFSNGLYVFSTINNDDGGALTINSGFNSNTNLGTYITGLTGIGNSCCPANQYSSPVALNGNYSLIYDYRQGTGGSQADLDECQMTVPNNDLTLSTYGSGTWNVYVYNAPSAPTYPTFGSGGISNYVGYVTAGSSSSTGASLSINTSDAAVTFGSVDALQGNCGWLNTGTSDFAVQAFLSNNFTEGIYTASTSADDYSQMSVNGNWVYQNTTCCQTQSITLALNGATNIIYEGVQVGGGWYFTPSITVVSPQTGTLSSNQSCGGSSSNITLSLSNNLGYAQLYSSTDGVNWTAVGSPIVSTTASSISFPAVSPPVTTFYEVITTSGSTVTSNTVGIITGTIAGNFTVANNVTLGGTINVNGNFTVNPGITLTVAQGCILTVNANNITINGNINADAAGNTGGSGGSGGYNCNCSSGCSSLNCNNAANPAGSGSGGSVGNGNGPGQAGNLGSIGSKIARAGCGFGNCPGSSGDGHNDGGPGGGGGGGGGYGGSGASATALDGGNGQHIASGVSPTGGAGGSAGSANGSSDLSVDIISLGSGGGGGGGGGGGSYCGSTGGNGGNGGGAVYLKASQTLTVGSSAVISANGASGGTGGAGSSQQGGYNKCTYIVTCTTTYDGSGGGGAGGGGGSGGGILLESFGAATIAGTIRANGGAGGTGGAQGDANSAGGMGGAGGGGGRIKIATNPCQTNSITASMTTTAGGVGTGANGNSNGTAGNTGTINTTIHDPAYAALTAGTVTGNQTICTGGTASAISEPASAGGIGTYSYQWYQTTTTCGATFTQGSQTPPSGWSTFGSASASPNFTPPALTQTTCYALLTVSGSCSVWSNVVTITVVAQPVAGTLAPTPAAGPVCTGGTVSAAFTPGSGGSGTVMDVLQVSLDGGPFSGYTSGANINTAGHISIVIQTYRTATGSNCNTSGTNTVTWNIAAQPIAGTLAPTPAAGQVCAGTDVSVVLTPGSGGSGTVTDVVQYQYDGTGPWNTYSVPLSTTGHTSVTIQTYRTATGSNCNTSGTNTVTWTMTPSPSVTISTNSDYITCQNTPVIFTATAANAGSPPLYQWYVGGVAYGGANASTFTYSDPTAETDAIYCVVTSTEPCPATPMATTTTIDMVVGVCTNVWTPVGTSTNWDDANNWSAVHVPSSCADGANFPGNRASYPILTQDENVGDVIIQAGAYINLSTHNLGVCQNWTVETFPAQSPAATTILGTGVITFDGQSSVTPQKIFGTTNAYEISIDNGGFPGGTGVLLASSTPATAAVVSNALDLVKSNFDVTNGTFTFASASPTQAAILDNFSPGNVGTITGNVFAERAYDISDYFVTKQHMLGFPVHGATLSQIGAAGSTGDVIPQPDCNEYYLEAGSPFGNVFSMVEGNGHTCGVGQWYVESGSTPDTTGKGYSVEFAGAGTLTVNGAPNVATSYQINGLTNDNWHNQTLQHHTLVSGWHLVTNPYLATLVINTSGGSGMDAQVQVWDANQGYSGSYQPNLGTNGQTVIAPFQAFMIHVTNPGTANYTISGADRSRTAPSTFYSQNANELDIVSTNLGSGVLDKTVVAFNTAATDSFDTQYDANKIAGGQGRHNLYTLLSNGTWMGINTLHDVATTSTVPVGFEPGVNGNYSFTFNKINTFDPTTYIYLEDLQQHVMYNVRNGDYLFSSDVNDNWSRFVLHFTPPAIISSVNATCNSLGVINVTQPGTANWNYTLTDGSNTVIASGVLNSSNSLSINAAAGTYTLTLVDNNNYTVTKVIQLAGEQPVAASFSASSNNVNTNAQVNFTNASQNANTYSWNFGDGSTTSNLISPVHTYTAPGVYTVELTATNTTGCSANSSQTITVSNTATAINVVTENGISMWSNKNNVYVDFTDAGSVDAVIKIYDVLGQELSEDHFTLNGLYQKEIDNVEAAYVIVAVKNNDKITTRKLFINNIEK